MAGREAGQGGALVLVVDDDPVLRVLARQALEDVGLQVADACDGRQALAFLAKRRPQLVLLDVEMPVLDGYATCAELRRMPGGEDIPVLIATGLSDYDSIERAFQAGATDFITKPLNWRILQHRVRFLLRASGAFRELRQTLSELSDSQRRLANAQRLARVGHFEWDPDGDEMLWSEELFQILGMTLHAVRPTLATFLAAVHPDDREAVEKTLRATALEGRAAALDHRLPGTGAGVRLAHLQTEAAGPTGRVAGTLQDVTERRQAEETIRYLAYYDSLTALPNRRMLKEHLGRSLARARLAGRPLALLILDVDRFKRVNDTFGPVLGDDLLRAVADRLLACVRANDCVGRSPVDAGSSLSRLGSDEFTIVVTEMRDSDDAARVARRVLDELRRPFLLAGHEIVVTASIGIAVHPADGSDEETLLRNAETAMYHAKDRGRESYQFYSPAMNARALSNLHLENGLRASLQREELLLHYQPQVSVATGRVVGLEALVRWNHPDLGLVFPDEFIGLAEECGLIVPLGAWVLRRAAAQARSWQEAGLPPISVAVNVSTIQLRDGEFVDTVGAALCDTGLEPDRLELEITESALFEDQAGALATLGRLKALGVRLALDDFGKGYSSLGRLRQLPFDALKVDRSFVQDVDRGEEGGAICAAIIAMARRLGLFVIAEGVQTRAQEVWLRAEGCDALQGYRFGRPVGAEEVPRVLGERLPRDVASDDDPAAEG
jgi:diguanylate cyclase (GGDEF)-like protein